MIVDDSAVIRGLTARWLESDSAIKVVASVSGGELALSAVRRNEPDVVVLDIEMPGMDGMTLLPKLLEVDPSLKIIMSSTLTQRNASISIKALAAGAADYVPKPTSRAELHQGTDFKRTLISKVVALGAARRGSGPSRPKLRARGGAARPRVVTAADNGAITLRKPGLLVPHALAIGSSTGGPKALFKLFESLKNTIRLPIFITQHMPPMFTTILADNIGRESGAPCAEAVDGEEVQKGHIYVAPGDHHMTVAVDGGAKFIRLNQDPPEHYCRPSVNPMFQSLAAAFGGQILGVVLTGMGSDGLEGGRILVEAGGTVIAQDEATSVVWGMPGAVAQDGVCSAVLPLEEIGPAISRIVSGGQA
jgi:two-component system chemotaxis response regulator CheB